VQKLTAECKQEAAEKQQSPQDDPARMTSTSFGMNEEQKQQLDQ